MNKKYIKGIYLNQKPNQPDFVIGQLSFKMEDINEVVEQLKALTNAKGYANIDILKSDTGPYLKPNTYGTEQQNKIAD